MAQMSLLIFLLKASHSEVQLIFHTIDEVSLRLFASALQLLTKLNSRSEHGARVEA